MAGHMMHMTRRTDFTYWGKDISVDQEAAPQFLARSFSVTANVRIPRAGMTGVLAATGSWFGGWSFYLKDGKPAAAEAFSQLPEDQFRIAASAPVAPGKATIRYDFDYDGGGVQRGGLIRISVDGKEVARGRIEKTIMAVAGLGETFDVGLDTGGPVSTEYAAEGRFAGDIDSLDVHLGPLSMSGAVGAAAARVKAGSE
jgi:arylsulfatase